MEDGYLQQVWDKVWQDAMQILVNDKGPNQRSAQDLAALLMQKNFGKMCNGS
jgi:hypothetical protein